MPIVAPKKRLRVVVFVSSLGAGGAERVAVRICGWLRDAGHEACLLTLSSSDSDFYTCPEGVARVALNLQKPSRGPLDAIWSNIRRAIAIRGVARAHRADTVIALGADSNILMLLALIGVRCRKIISERADPILQPLPLGRRLLRRLTYPMATLHVSQSNFVSEWLRQRFPKLRCEVIGNTAGEAPLLQAAQCISKWVPGSSLRLIAVSRLTHQKGIDLLLSAFALARMRSRTPIELVIVGDGEDRSSLLAQAEELGLDQSICFTGKVNNIWEQLSCSHMYVIPSRWEGFPNAMIEAITAGLPVIAARCKGGTEDLLGDVPGRYALEFSPGDIAGLADAIVTLADSPELRHRLAVAARTRAADFTPERIATAWLRAVEG